MPVNARIEVGAEAAQFAAFYERFRRYQQELERSGKTWRQISASSGAVAGNFGRGAVALREASETAERLLARTSALRNVSELISRSWAGLARSTGVAVRNIREATESFVRWAGVTSLVTGLVGGGSITLFGIGMNRLSDVVAARRTGALGAGASYGGYAAFGANFERVGGTQGILGAVAQAARDPNQAVGLRNLGLTERDLQGDTSDAAVKAIEALKSVVDRIRPEMIGPTLEAMHLQGTFSAEQARALKGMSREEVRHMSERYRDDKTKMGLTPDAQRRWQDFSTQMTRAGRTIENVFVTNLEGLAEPLTHLSASFTNLIEVMTRRGGPVAVWLEQIGRGFEWLAKHVESDEFHARIVRFLKSVGDLMVWTGNLLEGILSWARWLGVIPGAGTVPGAGSGDAGQPGTGGGAPSSRRAPEDRSSVRYGRPTGRFGPGSGGHIPGNMEGRARATMGAIRDQLRREGVPEANLDAAAAVLTGQARAESNFNATAVHDQGTGYGIYGARLERRDAMLSWLASHGYARESLEGQARYMAHEAMTGRRFGPTREALMRATRATLGEVTDVATRNFEAPRFRNNNDRRRAAEEAYGIGQAARTGGTYRVRVDQATGGNPVSILNATSSR